MTEIMGRTAVVTGGGSGIRTFVFDHAEQRHVFQKTYADVAEAAFDDIAACEKTHGVPSPDAGQPLLGSAGGRAEP